MSQQQDPDSTDGDPAGAGEVDAIIGTDVLDVPLSVNEAAAQEAVAVFTTDAMTMHSVDGAGVLLGYARVPAAAFESYDASSLSVGLRLDRVSGIARQADDVVRLAWDKDAFKFKIEAGPADATLSTIAPDEVRTKLGSRKVREETTTTATFEAADLFTAISSGDVIHAGVADVKLAEDGFSGLVFEGDTDDVRVELESVDFDVAHEDVSVMLSIDYLKELRQAIPKDATVTLHAKTDFPTVWEFHAEGVDAEFMLAPRLDKQ